MALGSWQGIYNAVILDLMEQKRERQLLLLMFIATHADQFGFAFPGRARQWTKRHVSKNTQLKDEQWLAENQYITVEDIEDFKTRQTRPFYQISPRVIYVRPELQEYCEAVFDGFRDRDYAWEKKVDLILLRTKESQPESLTRSRTSYKNQLQDLDTEPDTGPAATAATQKVRKATTMRNGPDQTEGQTTQRRQAQDRKNTPTGSGSGDEFDALLSPTVDDDRMIQEIRHIASTTEYQAREVVEIYPRDAIVHWLRLTARRRQKGELSNPGGWFFRMLKTQTPYPKHLWPDEWIEQAAYQDKQNRPDTDDMEI